MRPAVFHLAGPTGAGKSAAAVRVAEAVGAEIVNADAFQLYRGLEILTAAPSAAERARVPHHLFGVLGLDESCDAARYATMARAALAGLAGRGVPALVVGGSGMYLKALTHGLSDLPSDAVVRVALAGRSLDDKVAELQALDPAGAAAMNLTNERYVDRALEICLLTGRPASEARSTWAGADASDLFGVLLTWERAALCERIDRRVEAMFEAGVVAEVAAVLGAPSGVSATAEKAIGLREIRAHLAGEMTRADVVAAIQQATRRYAKRQMTWFRRERWLKTVCLSGDDTPDSAAAAIIREFSPMTEVPVHLSERSYAVQVGTGLLAGAGEAVRRVLPEARVGAVVTDSTVGPLYAERVEASLRAAGFEPTLITVPAGEPSKSMACAEDVCRQMIRAGLDRSSFVVALGGGVIGDLAGFCAAIFFRGLPYVQMPTTVVSLVDSSVGGKTGVNTPEGKNLLGSFHQPRLVLADVDTLATLPPREYNEGFAEIIKHAAIRDAAMLPLIERAHADRSVMAELIARNVAIKAAIVSADEHETTGLRALLNFGHTIGHGIEASAGYGQLLHGEAISLGLIAALRLSESVAGLDPAASEKIIALLRLYRLPEQLPAAIATADVMEKLSRDKKFKAGSIRFVLLRALGDAFVSRDVTLSQIEAATEALR